MPANKKQKTTSSTGGMPVIHLTPKVAVGGNHKPFIIAEGGNNHQGELENAKRLIDMAVLCGADCIKFQRRTIDRMLTKAARDAPYTGNNAFADTYGAHRQALELKDSDWFELKKYADDKNILFTASGWDNEAIDFLDSLDVPFFKMASADLTNLPLMEHTAKKGRPMVISTGMADLDMVKKHEQQVILHCVSTYPAELADLNLRCITTYINEFPNHVIGYSGHENGIFASGIACVLGAKVVERHITLNRTWKGSDHAASLEFDGLRRVVRDCKSVDDILGTGNKVFHEKEKPILKKLGKSLVTERELKKGHVLTAADLTTKSPGNGISPLRMQEFIGKKLNQHVDADVTLMEDMFA